MKVERIFADVPISKCINDMNIGDIAVIVDNKFPIYLNRYVIKTSEGTYLLNDIAKSFYNDSKILVEILKKGDSITLTVE